MRNNTRRKLVYQMNGQVLYLMAKIDGLAALLETVCSTLKDPLQGQYFSLTQVMESHDRRGRPLVPSKDVGFETIAVARALVQCTHMLESAEADLVAFRQELVDKVNSIVNPEATARLAAISNSTEGKWGVK